MCMVRQVSMLTAYFGKINIFATMPVSKSQKACLSREFKALKKKKSMAPKQKVAIALNVCKVSKPKTKKK